MSRALSLMAAWGAKTCLVCFFSSRRRHTRCLSDWSSDVCSSDLQEDRMGLTTPRPYREFEQRVFEHRNNLVRLIHALRADGKTICGYGASTKGNVLLQFCGFSARDIRAIAEVNPDKFGCFTPGTNIPIVSESEARAIDPDY